MSVYMLAIQRPLLTQRVLVSGAASPRGSASIYAGVAGVLGGGADMCVDGAGVAQSRLLLMCSSTPDLSTLTGLHASLRGFGFRISGLGFSVLRGFFREPGVG
eukprot:3768285-Rhodomonas_salina.6